MEVKEGCGIKDKFGSGFVLKTNFAECLYWTDPVKGEKLKTQKQREANCRSRILE